MLALDPEPLLRHLHERGISYVLIGGLAVAAHGYVRPSKDMDIVPAPDLENLRRLADALRAINARQASTGDFAPNEMPADPTRAEDLALGGNFCLDTDLGRLDVLQWVSGVDADDAFGELDSKAVAISLGEIPIRLCSLEHLRAMKRAAGRPRDIDDLENLPEA